MSELVTLYKPIYKCLEESEEVGKKLYKQNENYKSISNIMEHPEFRLFFDKHFSNNDDIRTMLLFLNIYKEIEKNAPVKLNGYQKIAVLDSIIKNKLLRRKLCNEICTEYKQIL